MKTKTTIIDAMNAYFEHKAVQKQTPMKTTNRRTYMLFSSDADKQKAIDHLLHCNIPFSNNVNRPILDVTAKRYFDNYLDLYLPEHRVKSTFSYSL